MEEIRPNIVMQFDLEGNFITKYRNCVDAGIATEICKRNIHQVAAQSEYKPGLTRKQAGGYVWKFKAKTNVV